ncbi:MAG: LamG domain-containing protein, partial [Bdellovibrionota bacterium]
MRKNKDWIWGGLFVLAAALTSCSAIEPGWHTISIQIGKRQLHLIDAIFSGSDPISSLLLPPTFIGPPSTISGFNCLAVNVVGPGISSTSNDPLNPGLFDSLLNRTSFCSYPGILVGPIPVTSQGEIFTLRVPSGPIRIAEMVGIQETTASVCSNQVPISNSDSSITSYFEIGRAVFDLKSDRKVEIHGDYNGLAAALQQGRKMNCKDPYSQMILSHPSLVSYWRLNEAGGTTATDYKGGIGPLAYTAATLAQPSGIVEPVGSSVSFNGGTSKADTPAGYFFTSGGVSFEAWVNMSSPCSAPKPLVYMRDNATAHVIRLGCDFSAGQGVPAFYLKAGGVTANLLAVGFPMNDSVWHHLVGTVDGANNVSIYFDGVQRGTTFAAFTGGWDVTGVPASTAIGFDMDTPSYFPGMIDEVAIYN